MKEISTELKNFRSKVKDATTDMDSRCSDFVTKAHELATKSTEVKSKLSNYYNSNNQSTILSKFDRIQEIYGMIESSVDGDLRGIINDAKTLVTLIDELEEYENNIKTQEQIYEANNNDNGDFTKKINAQNAKMRLENEFDKKHSEAEKKLAALKAKDADLSFVNEFSPNNSKINPDNLKYGRLEPRSFKSSNGIVVNYWLYIPDYGYDEVEGLPAMLYMHGGSRIQDVSLDHAIQYGMPSKIANKELTPSGVVIIPAVCDFSEDGIVALKELTDSVVEEQKCDTNRISVSGHSYGAITAYKLINRYPHYWSACVGISGKESVTSAFSDVPTWQFVGDQEVGTGSTSLEASKDAVNLIRQIGKAKLTVLTNTGHAGSNRDTYGQTYESPDGIVENPMDWAFRQTRA